MYLKYLNIAPGRLSLLHIQQLVCHYFQFITIKRQCINIGILGQDNCMFILFFLCRLIFLDIPVVVVVYSCEQFFAMQLSQKKKKKDLRTSLADQWGSRGHRFEPWWGTKLPHWGTGSGPTCHTLQQKEKFQVCHFQPTLTSIGNYNFQSWAIQHVKHDTL